MAEEWPAEPRMRDKVAIVTGAGAQDGEIGIGRAIALILAREGAQVICVDVDAPRADRTAEMIAAQGGRALPLRGDVTDAESCVQIVHDTVAAFGRLDCLVNNVGVGGGGSLLEVDVADWKRQIDLNFTSAFLMARSAVPAMVGNGGGAIVNIASLAGRRASGAIGYGPSKAAMHQLSREIAVLHGRDGIRANTVAPGHILTPMTERLLPARLAEAQRRVGPLSARGDAWDVARAVLFLASDDARFITGVELPVDGGADVIAPLAVIQGLLDD